MTNPRPWTNPMTGEQMTHQECVWYYITLMEVLCVHKDGAECETVKVFKEELENPTVPEFFLALKAHEFVQQLIMINEYTSRKDRANKAWLN